MVVIAGGGAGGRWPRRRPAQVGRGPIGRVALRGHTQTPRRLCCQTGRRRHGQPSLPPRPPMNRPTSPLGPVAVRKLKAVLSWREKPNTHALVTREGHMARAFPVSTPASTGAGEGASEPQALATAAHDGAVRTDGCARVLRAGLLVGASCRRRRAGPRTRAGGA